MLSNTTQKIRKSPFPPTQLAEWKGALRHCRGRSSVLLEDGSRILVLDLAVDTETIQPAFEAEVELLVAGLVLADIDDVGHDVILTIVPANAWPRRYLHLDRLFYVFRVLGRRGGSIEFLGHCTRSADGKCCKGADQLGLHRLNS